MTTELTINTPEKGYDEEGNPIVQGIVAGAGTAVLNKNSSLGAAIEAAMIKATLDCAVEGIIDDKTVRARKLAARDRVKKDYNAAMEAQAATRKKVEEEAVLAFLKD